MPKKTQIVSLALQWKNNKDINPETNQQITEEEYNFYDNYVTNNYLDNLNLNYDSDSDEDADSQVDYF